MLPAVASAHTIQICWQDVGSVTTFYADTYHSPFEGPSPIGKIIVDGFGYPFSGWIYPSALPATAHCWSAPGYMPAGGNLDGVPSSSVVHYQTFTSSFQPGLHTISFDATTVIQTPIANFPVQTFGGGGCADADFDGLCNDVDACPLDAANDGDGDGICGNVDNCPLNANSDQTDANHNGQGDVCEGLVCGNGLVQGA
jgi:chitinase